MTHTRSVVALAGLAAMAPAAVGGSIVPASATGRTADNDACRPFYDMRSQPVVPQAMDFIYAEQDCIKSSPPQGYECSGPTRKELGWGVEGILSLAALHFDPITPTVKVDRRHNGVKLNIAEERGRGAIGLASYHDPDAPDDSTGNIVYFRSYPGYLFNQEGMSARLKVRLTNGRTLRGKRYRFPEWKEDNTK